MGVNINTTIFIGYFNCKELLKGEPKNAYWDQESLEEYFKRTNLNVFHAPYSGNWGIGYEMADIDKYGVNDKHLDLLKITKDMFEIQSIIQKVYDICLPLPELHIIDIST